MKQRGDIAVYKPNNKQTGSVAQFKMSNKNDCMFLECTNQIAPKESAKPYDWDQKISVKLGVPDICKFMAYLNLHQPGAPLKLFHQSPGGGTKTIELKWQEYAGRQSYYLSVSHQTEKSGDLKRVSIPIGLDEVEFLKVGFRKALEIILAWD